ncbi:alpha/beta fold hydrolase [Lolliginicoccus levis]|uniref:alpha/beta fold hydrolase n=1 Tax=Lolliginicoccus levis TaxID=2919542 RepID=UPI00241EBCB4|nr:alpha/beta hydrolase [Lolliginicoccus levis]
MPYIEQTGARIHFTDSGGADLPVIVLAHGFFMDTSMFAPQVEALSDRYRVVCIDARGHGATMSDDTPFTYWDAADDVLAVLDEIGVQRAVLGGMSQGGFTMLRAALMAPERVTGLILISTEAGPCPDEEQKIYGETFLVWDTIGPVDELTSALAGQIIGDPELEPAWIAKWRDRKGIPIATAGNCLLYRDDITDQVPSITAPAILIRGLEDVAIPIERARSLIDNLPDLREVVEVPGAAHAVNLTHPEVVNPRIEAFLARLSTSGAAR